MDVISRGKYRLKKGGYFNSHTLSILMCKHFFYQEERKEQKCKVCDA